MGWGCWTGKTGTLPSTLSSDWMRVPTCQAQRVHRVSECVVRLRKEKPALTRGCVPQVVGPQWPGREEVGTQSLESAVARSSSCVTRREVSRTCHRPPLHLRPREVSEEAERSSQAAERYICKEEKTLKWFIPSLFPRPTSKL